MSLDDSKAICCTLLNKVERLDDHLNKQIDRQIICTKVLFLLCVTSFFDFLSLYRDDLSIF